MPLFSYKPLFAAVLVAISGLSYAETPASDDHISPEPDTTNTASSVVFLHPQTLLETEEVDLWNRIRNGYGIPDLENPLVNSQVNWYSARADYIQRTTARASRYLYHVVEELENAACRPNWHCCLLLSRHSIHKPCPAPKHPVCGSSFLPLGVIST